MKFEVLYESECLALGRSCIKTRNLLFLVYLIKIPLSWQGGRPGKAETRLNMLGSWQGGIKIFHVNKRKALPVSQYIHQSI